MLTNYITSALRSLRKNKGFTAINILGLSIGLGSFILITLYVYHELSFDKYHTKADRIFRVVENLRTENEMLFQSTSSPPMGPSMHAEFPEVESYVRMQRWNLLIARGEKSAYSPDFYLADSSIFDIFSFKLLAGDPKTALREPRSVVLTSSLAKNFFDDADPLGEMLSLDGEMYKITGVVADIPENSHFRPSAFISFSTWSSRQKQNEMTAWYWNGFHTYLLLRDPSDAPKVRAKMKNFIERKIGKGGMYYEDLPLQSLTSIYLEVPRSWENGKRGSRDNIVILSAIGMFILLVASFNYINLATARASRRLKEVGLRKMLGARRHMLIGQFMGESLIVSVTAAIIGLAIAFLALPAFRTLTESTLGLSIFPNPWTALMGLLALAIVIGLFSGAYPAFLISGFRPMQIFRPALGGFLSQQLFRKVLVTAQFVISITLVAGTLFVFDQLQLVRNRDLGFTKDMVLVVPTNGDQAINQHLDAVKSEFTKVNGVVSAGLSSSVPGRPTTNNYYEIEMKDGKMSPTNINMIYADHDFLATYDIPMVAGRNFSRENKADDSTAYILNETAVRDFGWTLEEAIGKRVNKYGKVIGVAKDFNYLSLHHSIDPLMLAFGTWGSSLSIHIKSDDVRATVEEVGVKWHQAAPHLPYEYRFLDDDYNEQYKADSQLGRVAGLFTGLAIIIGCLGLLGLTSFSVERRVKEIGIRKVMGATVANLLVLIAKDFVLLIALAFVVSVPITWYLVDRWLENFTDQIVIGPLPFLVAGGSVIVLAWLTTSFLSFRAAAANPTEALREN